MNRTIILSRYCCAACGGQRVEALDWVTVNGTEVVGGDPGEDYWCPDCETHPSAIEAREVVLTLCAACAAHQWGTAVPLPGVVVAMTGAIECCDGCGIYPNALEAARALSAEVERRGGRAGVSIVVDGLRPARIASTPA